MRHPLAVNIEFGLQRSRPRAGAEIHGTLPLNDCLPYCFNGAAPARGRKYCPGCNTPAIIYLLQRSRPRAGAEIPHIVSGVTFSNKLQRSRPRAGAEMS